ncbi:unnamed protein product [Pylaiella littoralis]
MDRCACGRSSPYSGHRLSVSLGTTLLAIWIVLRVSFLAPYLQKEQDATGTTPAGTRTETRAPLREVSGDDNRHQLEGGGNNESSLSRDPTVVMEGGREIPAAYSEAYAIKPIKKSFLQDPDRFRERGNGISLEFQGEPKSGTTWFGRLIVQLALELCGNYNNLW